jgi:hypothetical protein
MAKKKWRNGARHREAKAGGAGENVGEMKAGEEERSSNVKIS